MMHTQTISRSWFITLALVLVFMNSSIASENSTVNSARFVGEFVERNCAECHSGSKVEGELNLTQLAWRLDTVESRRQWILVHDRIEKGEMPPDGTLLKREDRKQILQVLSDVLHEADHAEVLATGRGPMRRLNRREYEQNLRDLLHLPDLDVRDILPEDREGHHFTKSAEMLDVTQVQLAAYLEAAEAALMQAVASGSRPRTPMRYFALATNMFPKAVDHAGRESTFYAKSSKMISLSSGELEKIRKQNRHDPEVEVAIFRSASWPYYGYPEGFLAEAAGRYRVRFFARAVRQVRDFRLLPAIDPVPMTFRARKPSKADVSGDVRAVGGLMDIQSEGAEYETTILLAKGETFEYSLLGLPVPFPITSHGGPLYYDFPPMPGDGHPGVALRWIEITGPLDSSSWPPESHRVLFGDLPIKDVLDENRRLRIEVQSQDPKADVERLLHSFAARAARHPVPEAALDVYRQLILHQLDHGAPLAEAILAGYQAFLCSSHFLFLCEPGGAFDQQEIASRLSNFLWNSRADDSLRSRATRGELRNTAVLLTEANRLIEDSRFDNFVDNFSDSWLDLKNIRRDLPDSRLYPEYRFDDYLIESMERETRAYFRSMVRDNLPISMLIDSNFVMINDRLAKHYELPKITGSAIRKVVVPEASPYGGLITQAAVMKVTANGTTTSPVIRGAWIMDRILGDPPPPPPAKVPAIEPDLRGATTIREQLAKHTQAAECASCHARFDPIGFALENFDILGGWRERYRSLEKGDEITGIDRAGHLFSYRVAGVIAADGKMLDGRAFEDIFELKRLLISEPRQLARNLLHQFTVYATGTPVRFSDRREIEAILDQCGPVGYRVGDLLRGLIQNRIFVGEIRGQSRPETSEGEK